jgi:general secretion pathway protein G
MLLRSAARRNLNTQRRAFTLLEILVVVAIIVMLAGVGGYYIMQRYEDSKLSLAKTGLVKIDGAVGAYRLAYGQNPDNLDILTQKGENGGPYLRQDELMDPWGKKYNYEVSGNNNQGTKPDVSTLAPNGKTIGNWESLH